ncbi:MAG: DUF4241 domain-containing protein [Phycisphaerae bacterium]
MEYDELDRRLRIAFQDGAQFRRNITVLTPETDLTPQHRRLEFVGRNVEIGTLRLATGRIVAADVLAMLRYREPFVRSVPPGEYPVTITVATDADERRHVAFARIMFRRAEVAWWDHGETLETRRRRLPIEHYEGYGVDSGTGAFLDAATARFLLKNDQHRNPDAFLSAIQNDPLTPTLAAFPTLPPRLDRSLALFVPGLGDSVCDSYWGIGDDREPVCLLTDFNLAGDPTCWDRTSPTFLRRARDWAIAWGLLRA